MDTLAIIINGFGSSLLQGIALLLAIALSITLYHSLTVSSPVSSIGRLIGLVVGAEVSIFILLSIILPAGLMDEGEIIGPMLLTIYLTPMFWRLKHDSTQLAREKELAVVTLASIGDAVITTDLQCRVKTLNPVAEQLTGWESNLAKGRTLEEVFCVINELTREKVPNPARQAIIDGTIFSLADHSILIARDGSESFIEDSAAPIRDGSGQLLGSVLVFRDVSHSRELVKKLSWQAGHDQLTGLPNRALLADRLALAIAQAHRTGQLLLVCLMDLDGFKAVNDKCGHDIGDKLLSEVSIRLQGAVRGGDTVARLGGDEFVLLLTQVEEINDVSYTMDRIIAVVSNPYEIDGYLLEISASVGVTIYPFDEADADTLIRHADHAMYQVKEQGRRHYRLFDATLAHEDMARQHHLERVRQAVENHELMLYYQPKVDMRKGKIVGFEALLRWNHPERGIVGPLDFLPMVEQTEIGLEIGQWVLNEALQQMVLWNHEAKQYKVSVNISAKQLLHPDFIVYLKELLCKHAEINPALLELEILESAALNDLQAARTVILDCQSMGVVVAIDDFGTGYSSLAYIKNLPANVVKIDQAFVRDMLHDHEDHALVEAIIKLSHLFKKQVIAEGVETMMHGIRLMSLGCDMAQGYGIARPMPAKDVSIWAESYEKGSVWIS